MIETDPKTRETVPPRTALSIVIPVYNGASSIAELIGALEQFATLLRVGDKSRAGDIERAHGVEPEQVEGRNRSRRLRSINFHHLPVAKARPK